MTIRQRFLILLAVVALLVASAYWSNSQIGKGVTFTRLNLNHVEAVQELDALLRQHRQAGRKVEAAPGPGAFRSAVKRIGRQSSACLAMIGPLDRFVLNLAGTGEVLALCEADQALEGEALDLIEAYESGDVGRGAFLSRLEGLQGQFSEHDARFTPQVARTVDFVRRSATFMQLGFGLAVLAGLALMAHRTLQPLSAITAAMQQLAGGDTTLAVPARNRRDEIGRMAAALEVFKQTAQRDKAREADQRQQAEARAASLARFPEENTNPVLRAHSDGQVLYANPAARAEWPGTGLSQAGEQLNDDLAARVGQALASGHRQSAELATDQRWFLVSVVPIPDEGYANLYGVEITERKRFEKELQDRIYYDALTGIANRVLFLDRLDQALHGRQADGRRAAVLFLGLDNFEAINGWAGHDAGDGLLQSLAEGFCETVEAEHTVARLGGDVFAILVPVLAGDDAAAAATLADLGQRLISLVDRETVIAGRNVDCGASIGVARYPDDGSDAEALMKNADLAMARAKRDGGSRVAFYFQDLNVRVSERHEIVHGLRRALADGELRLHYQPQLTPDGTVIGAEALMRWQAPDGELISPGRFIPVAEETGLIQPMGEWALGEACRQAKAWSDAGRRLRVAVNLAAPHFLEGNLPALIEGELARYDLDPSVLEIEITESAVMADRAAASSVMRRLGQLGVTVAMDDFGTGYSSLAYLKDLPVHRLKIDRQFVWSLPGNDQDTALCRTIIDLGQNLGLSVLAEGVETDDHVAWLHANGCDELQGFHYAKPMPGEAFASWLDRPHAGAQPSHA